jgi:hypothetical protein
VKTLTKPIQASSESGTNQAATRRETLSSASRINVLRYIVFFVLGAAVTPMCRFPKTELVVINATPYDVNQVVIKLPAGPRDIGTVPAGDLIRLEFREETVNESWKPMQKGIMKDGRELVSNSVTGSSGRLRRIRYTIWADASVSASFETRMN